MNRLQQVRAAAGFAVGIYQQRVASWYWARVRHDTLARLALPSVQSDPYPIYDEIRAGGALVRTRLGNWSSASHSTCREVLRSRKFGVRPETDNTPGFQPPEILDLSLLELNPPDHTRLRRLAAPAFSPRRMAGYQVLVEKTVHRLLDDAVRRGSFDLVTDFASPLPVAVITELLGIPDADVATFARYGATVGQALDGVGSLRQMRRLVAAQRQLRSIFDDLYALRAREPQDDVISALVAQRGEEISVAELTALSRLLLIAGFETTVNAIGNGVRALLADPDQWQLLVADPSLAPVVVEEVLRYDPPVQVTARVALEPVEVAGVSVRRDQWVLTLIAGANRDPDVFPRPNRFDVTREQPAEHLAFSGGIHYCLGAPLARMELGTAFRILAERMPRLALSGPVRMRRSTTLHGALSMPVSLS